MYHGTLLRCALIIGTYKLRALERLSPKGYEMQFDAFEDTVAGQNEIKLRRSIRRFQATECYILLCI